MPATRTQVPTPRPMKLFLTFALIAAGFAAAKKLFARD